nr:uncharacterized protein LOC111511827 [Leptinotarsa decemlineata]
MIVPSITNRIIYKIHCFIYLQFVEGLVVNNEVLEMGKTQYNLLKDKSVLPRYGSCWKSAVQHLETSCRYLNENIQSEIALHITNCFLEMSGHPTYDCEFDKKVNLRAICINSMSDRAFNVYTEFYTHTQNICWFLQGQIWNEIIADNTILVGKQLKETAQNQEGLLQAQIKSFKLQMQMYEHGKVLENVLHDIFVSFETNQSTLKLLSAAINNLQDWIVGEISWIDSAIFYSISVLSVFALTATRRTSSARLPILLVFFFHLLIERYFCSIMVSNNSGIEAHIVHSNIYNYVWYSRYGLLILAATIFIYNFFVHNDILTKQFELLCMIQNQNNRILSLLNESKNNFNFYKPKIALIDDSCENSVPYLRDDISHISCCDGDISNFNPSGMAVDKCTPSKREEVFSTKHKKSTLPIIENDKKVHGDIKTTKYNLRSNSSLR